MTDRTRSPIIRTETGRFARYINIDGLGLRGFVDFEKTIQWFRETETRTIVLAPNGHEIHHGSTYNDFYGLMTSMNDSFSDARRFCEHYDVAHTGCVVAVILECNDILGIVIDEENVIRGMTSFHRIPDDWIRHDPELQDAYMKASWDERLEISFDHVRTIQRDPVTLWRSDWDAEQIDQARPAFDALLENIPEEHRFRINSNLDELLKAVSDVPRTKPLQVPA